MQKVIFCGTDVFAVPVLRSLHQEYGRALTGVITQPDRASGRGGLITPPPVKHEALALGIPIFQPESKHDLSLIIQRVRPDLAIIAAYGRLIPQDILQAVPFGWINIHPSFLPLHRGPSPVESALLAGDAKTGVSFLLLDEEMDHGPILFQHAVPLYGNETQRSLSQQLSEIGARFLPEVLRKYGLGVLLPQEQNHKEATYTKLFQREDGLVVWDAENAEAVDRKVRAFDSWPGTFCILPGGARLKILSGRVCEAGEGGNVGQKNPYCAAHALYFTCRGGGAYEASLVQREGKKPMSGGEFCKGYRV